MQCRKMDGWLIIVNLILHRTAEDIIMGIGGSKATDKAGQAISNHPEIVK